MCFAKKSDQHSGLSFLSSLIRCRQLIFGRSASLSAFSKGNLKGSHHTRMLKLISGCKSYIEQSPRTSACTASAAGCILKNKKTKDVWAAQQKLTGHPGWCAFRVTTAAQCASSFGHCAAIGFRGLITVGSGRIGNTLATLSLLVEILPFGPVCLDHINHRLKFGIQLD